MKAEEILTKAAGHLADRAKTYDKPEGERSMEKTVAMFNTLTGTQLTTEQGWLFMVILKMVRSQQGDYKADNYEDGAAYFALAGERTSAPKKLKVPPELQFVARCLRCGVEEGMLHDPSCPVRKGWPNVPDERPVQTRRQQLIAAGIPAHEFDGIKNHRLDEPADGTPNETLADAFLWSDSPQGSEHWEKWESLLD